MSDGSMNPPIKSLPYSCLTELRKQNKNVFPGLRPRLVYIVRIHTSNKPNLKKMGAPPELPNPSEDDLRLIEANVHHPQIVSDESDNEQNDYEGYEPLAIDDEQENIEVEQQQNSIEVNSSLPVIERAEFELERQVWNAPRPQETNIELDATRTAQILNAMASFTLPNLVLPEWAVGVPEERWKEVLLERIRQSKEEQQDISETT